MTTASLSTTTTRPAITPSDALMPLLMTADALRTRYQATGRA